MGMALQLRRGTTAEVNSFSDGVEGELILDTQTHVLYVSDASGIKHPISGGGSGSTGTEWSSMPTYDAASNIITIINEDGSETLIDIATPQLDSAEVNQLIVDAVAAIPDASGLTIESLDTLREQLESKIDMDNAVQNEQIAAVFAAVGDNGESIAVLAASATATADEIAASVVTDLYAKIGTNASGLQAEQNVRALADLTMGQDVTNLTSEFNDNVATVSSQLTTLTTDSTSHGQSITGLLSTTGGLEGSVASLEQDLNTLTTDTTAVASTVTSLGSTVGNVEANMVTLSETVASSDSTALAENITALSSTVGEHTTAITSTTSSLNGITGKRSITLNANGDVTGFEMLGGGGSGSQVKFTTDNFVVSGSGATDKKPFTISNGNVSINGDLIATGTITSDQLSANAISTEMINSMDTGNGMTFSLGTTAPWSAEGLMATGVFESSTELAHALVAVGTNTGADYTGGFGSVGQRIAFAAVNTGAVYSDINDRQATFIAANGGLTWDGGGGNTYGSVSYISNLQNHTITASNTVPTSNQVTTHTAVLLTSGGAFGLLSDGDIQTAGYVYAVRGFYPFTGGHDGLVAKSETPEVGDILVDTGVAIKDGISNTITELSSSSSSNQKGVVGVYERRVALTTKLFPEILGGEISYLESGDGLDPNSKVQDIAPEYAHYIDTHDAIAMNSLGEGQVNVVGEGGNLEIGDLIVTSSINGKGKKQGDDIIRSTTVAKVRENVSFSSPTEIKQIACIYLCG
jgi:uncharacterized protein YoxC